MFRAVFAGIFFGIISISAAFSQIYQTESGHAEVIGGNYTGTSDKLRGSINKNNDSVDFRLLLETIDTGNNMRNKDMLKSLDAETYPYTSFKGLIISPYKKNSKSTQKVRVKGDFTIHGQTKTVEVPGTLTFKNNETVITAEFPVRITEHGIKRPGMLFMKVEDEHLIKVEASLK